MTASVSPVSSASGQKADFGCLVCRFRKIGCDKTLPSCHCCRRLGVRCPGFNEATRSMTRLELRKAAQDIFSAAGLEKRRFGSCKECRATKARCCRSQPTCTRCAARHLQCVYDHSKPAAASGAAHQHSSPELSSNIREPHNASLIIPSDTSSTDLGAVNLPLETLLTETLPENDRLISHLVNTYFNRVHCLRVYSFIHKPSFLVSLRRGSVERDFGRPLLQVMCALGARVLYMDTCFSSQPDQRSLKAKPGDAWAEAARHEIMTEIHIPTIPKLMTTILLGEYALRTEQNALAFVLSGCTFRAIQLLGHSNLARVQDSTTTAWPAGLLQETWNRLVWASYAFDVFLASGVELNSAWQNHIPKVPLPCSNRDFLAQTPGPTKPLHHDVKIQDTALFSELDLPALMIILVRLRGAVLKLIRCPPAEEKEPWDPNSLFMNIINQLDALGDNIPDRLCMTDLNIYVHKDEHTLGAVFCLHILHHAVAFDLTRISLAGFTFPLAAAFHNAPPSFRLQCQQRANFHASELSGLTRKALAHMPASFDDPFFPDAILESAKIQIIFASTVANDDETLRNAADNVRTNLRALSLIHPGIVHDNPYIRFILPLCSYFNFKDVFNEWSKTQPLVDTPVEITGSADLEHLVPYAPFRKAVSQLHAKQTAARNANAQISSAETPSNSRPPIISSAATDQQNASSSNTWPETSPGLQQPAFSGTQQPTNFEMLSPANTLSFGDDNQAVLGADSVPVQRLSAEDYTRAAGQLSGYITWDMADLPFMATGQQYEWMENELNNDTGFEQEY